MKIEGSTALVTGANRGLGKAIVSALLGAGAAKVYAAARDEKTVTRDDPRVIAIPLDTTKPETIAAASGRAGDVTLLINNAGVLTGFDVLKTTQAELDAAFRTNVYGTLDVIKTFVPVLEQAPDGATIVNILSLVSLGSFPTMGGYSASKAAAYSITQSLRAGLKSKRIAVLAALPGPIDTDMVRAFQMPKASAEDTAKGIVAGIARGDEEIFPDPMAQQMGALWNRSHKEYERAFASL
jgi:NAD(P)-dependent dehydrogenase (short-subunit alcohol dehydrogenase family)